MSWAVGSSCIARSIFGNPSLAGLLQDARDSGAIAWISDEIGLQRESPLVSRVREVHRARLARH
jgi:hypothetical protein